MPAYYGDDALLYLSKQIKKDDPKSSSHWDKFHKDFSFTGNDFVGVDGFGSNEKKYTGLRRIAHSLLQIPFDRMGRRFSDFNSVNNVAKHILDSQDKGYSLDVLRQVITLAYLNDKKVIKDNGLSCVIGDGYAMMTSLLLKSSHQRVVLVNLTKTLLMDLWQLKLLLGSEFDADVVLITDKDSMLRIVSETEKKPVVIAIKAENHQLIQLCPIDLTINIASMQEMNPEFIVEYFIDISIAAKKRSGFFYCCNREEKTLPDGTMVNFEEYPWNLADEILEDELCPWHQKHYNTKFPFYHNYDGSIRHRLVRFR